MASVKGPGSDLPKQGPLTEDKGFQDDGVVQQRAQKANAKATGKRDADRANAQERAQKQQKAAAMRMGQDRTPGERQKSQKTLGKQASASSAKKIAGLIGQGRAVGLAGYRRVGRPARGAEASSMREQAAHRRARRAGLEGKLGSASHEFAPEVIAQLNAAAELDSVMMEQSDLKGDLAMGATVANLGGQGGSRKAGAKQETKIAPETGPGALDVVGFVTGEPTMRALFDASEVMPAPHVTAAQVLHRRFAARQVLVKALGSNGEVLAAPRSLESPDAPRNPIVQAVEKRLAPMKEALRHRVRTPRAFRRGAAAKEAPTNKDALRRAMAKQVQPLADLVPQVGRSEAARAVVTAVQKRDLGALSQVTRQVRVDPMVLAAVKAEAPPRRQAELTRLQGRTPLEVPGYTSPMAALSYLAYREDSPHPYDVLFDELTDLGNDAKRGPSRLQVGRASYAAALLGSTPSEAWSLPMPAPLLEVVWMQQAAFSQAAGVPSSAPTALAGLVALSKALSLQDQESAP